MGIPLFWLTFKIAHQNTRLTIDYMYTSIVEILFTTNEGNNS